MHEVVPVSPSPQLEDKFSIENVLGLGWNGTKKFFFPLLGVMTVNGLLAMLVPIATFFIGANNSLAVENMILSFGLGLLSTFIAITIELGMIKVNLMVLDDQTVRPDDCFKVLNLLPNYFVAWLIARTVTMFGFFCFVIPGIILHISFQFFGYFIVERGMGPLEALKASWAVCDGARWNLVMLSIVLWFVNTLGFMCFFLGMIPAHMIDGISLAATYRELLSKTSPYAETIAQNKPSVMLTGEDLESVIYDTPAMMASLQAPSPVVPETAEKIAAPPPHPLALPPVSPNEVVSESLSVTPEDQTIKTAQVDKDKLES